MRLNSPGVVHEFRRLAERPCEIGDHIAGIQFTKFAGGIADRLDHDGYGAFRRIVIGNGKRNPFALFVEPQNDELPGFSRLCHTRSLDIHPVDVRGQ